MAKTIKKSMMRLKMARKEAAEANKTWVIFRKLCRPCKDVLLEWLTVAQVATAHKYNHNLLEALE